MELSHYWVLVISDGLIDPFKQSSPKSAQVSGCNELEDWIRGLKIENLTLPSSGSKSVGLAITLVDRRRLTQPRTFRPPPGNAPQSIDLRESLAVKTGLSGSNNQEGATVAGSTLHHHETCSVEDNEACSVPFTWLTTGILFSLNGRWHESLSLLLHQRRGWYIYDLSFHSALIDGLSQLLFKFYPLEMVAFGCWTGCL
ncbi:uncharacterized protein G2W53_007263 [Senna tora]|uniref:Uncharacterized protein n=1 Tax=Senna tora TaxID=362788 RepID=A0A835CDF7_9FABA|nr:uncharacterized protein G2W53_007263 [Senna tora]